MTTKTAARLLIQEPVKTAESTLPTAGLGEAALEIQKTTGQVAQKEAQQHAATLLTPRPSLSGRATSLSPSTPEEDLLFTPPSKRENRSNTLSLAPGSDERVPAAAKQVVPLQGSLWGSGSASSSAQSSPNKSLEAPGSDNEAADPNQFLDMEASSQENSPIKANSQHLPAAGTPSPIKAAKKVVLKNNPTCSLMPRDSDRIKRGVDYLNKLTSPQHSTQVAAVRTVMASALAQTSPVAHVSPKNPTQRNLLLAMDECSKLDDSWGPLLESTQTFVLDAGHLRKFNGAGKHICPAGDPDDAKILKRYTNLKTGIWCGVINDGKKGEKFSSLIPRSMTELEYLTHISGAISRPDQLIARGANKALLMLTDEKNSLCVEIYTEKNGHKVNSAFPIFHYEEYTEKSTILTIEMEYEASIQDKDPIASVLIKIPYEAILKEVKSLKNNDEAIEFETKTHRIVDVALLFNSDPALCPIARGILVSIPKKFLK
jgi:hypothetical protein